MRVAFAVAPDGGALIDQCYVGFSFGGPDVDGRWHTLDLTRAPGFEPDDPDWGPYLEYDGVQCHEPQLAAVRLSREVLSLDLSRPFSGQTVGPVGFDLALAALSDDRYRELAVWLPLALRGPFGLLVDAEPAAAPDPTSM